MKNFIKILTLLLFISTVTFYSCNKQELPDKSTDKEENNSNSTVMQRKNIIPFEDYVALNQYSMPTFNSWTEYYKFMELLENYRERYDNYYYTDLEDKEENCVYEHQLLDRIEEELGFVSLRTKYAIIECNQLEENYHPKELWDCPVNDEIHATFYNEYGEMQIEDKIYKVISPSLSFVATENNVEYILNAQETGEINLNYVSAIGNSTAVQLTTADATVVQEVVITCHSEFTVIENAATLSVTINWTGDTEAHKKVQFLWGDGSAVEIVDANDANATHTYSSAGQYQITATVIDETENAACFDSSTQPVDLEPECDASLTATTGINGVVTFNATLDSDYSAESWLFNFGDGETETVSTSGTSATVTHTYECEQQFTATVTITTDDPNDVCNPTESANFQVQGLICLDLNYEYAWDTEEYNGGDNEIKYKTWLSGGSNNNRKKVKAKFKNYKLKNNGNGYKKEKADLTIHIYGNVFKAGANGCDGGNDIPIDSDDTEFNTKSHTYKRNQNEKIGVDETDPYYVDFLVDNISRYIKETNDADCQ